MKKAEKRLPIFFLVAVGAVLFFRYLFFSALPFLLAFAAASLLHGPSQRLALRLHLPYRIVSVGLAVLFVSLLLGSAGFLIWQTASQIGAFARATLGGENDILENISDILAQINEKLSGLALFSGEDAAVIRERIGETVSDMIKNTLVAAASRIPGFAGKLVAAIPQILIFFAVTVLAAVYFCMDYEKISAFFREKMPQRQFAGIQKVFSVCGETAVKFARSYLLLFLFTFSVLFLGFALLGEAYAFLFALITALVDSLPILGTGAVLVPLALYHFIIGDTGYGIGACVLYLAVMILRQVCEPKILGAGMGIHPLFMLTAMYTGLQLFGIFGMLAAPFCAAIFKNLMGVWKRPHEETT